MERKKWRMQSRRRRTVKRRGGRWEKKEEKDKKNIIPQYCELRGGLVLDCGSSSQISVLRSHVVSGSSRLISTLHTVLATPTDCLTLRPRRHHAVAPPSLPPRHVHTLSAQKKFSRYPEICSGSVPFISFSHSQLAEYD